MKSNGFFVLLSAALVLIGSALAWSAESAYSQLDLDKHCKFENPASEEEAGMGASGICQVGNWPPIYFAEGDLRQSAGFGADKQFQSFAQFNYMNTTIEWRSDGGRPYAAIVRFFIEYTNPETGIQDKANRGQVLVVHRVAETPDGQTCIVGLVDARANGNANVIAREVADDLASSFNCETDKARYYGRQGKYAGTISF